MPAYLQQFEIDWSWPRLSESEREVALRHEAHAQAGTGQQTLATLAQVLAAASRELAGRELRALAADTDGQHVLIARDGSCAPAPDASFNPEGKLPQPLTAADFRAVGIAKLYVTLSWPENMLLALKERASRLECSLSWLVEHAWAASRQGATALTMGEEALVSDGPRRWQSVYLSVDTYEELTTLASKERRSISFLVQRALVAAWPSIQLTAPGG